MHIVVVYVTSGEGWPQILHKIANEFESQGKSTSRNVDMSKVEKCAFASKPKKPEEIPAMAKFVQLWGGGRVPTFAKEVIVYMQTGVINPDGHHVASTFFEALNSLHKNFTPLELPIVLVHAVLLVHAQDPVMQDGICRGISVGDVAKLGNKLKAAAISSNHVLRNARELVYKDANLSTSLRASLLFTFYKRVVWCTFKNNKKIEEGFKSIEAAVKSLTDSMVSAGSENPLILLTTVESNSASAASDHDAGSNVVEYDSVGNPIGTYRMTLENSGYKTGNTVEYRVKDSVHSLYYKIDAIHDTGDVTLCQFLRAGGQSTTKIEVIYADFVKSYKPSSASYQFCQHYPSGFAATSKDVTNSCLKGKVSEAVRVVQQKYDMQANIQIHMSPKECVWATQAYKKGELVFVPSTLCITCQEDPSVAIPEKVTTIVVSIDKKESRFLLLKTTPTKTFVAPFWHLRVVTDPKLANFLIYNKCVKIPAAHMKGDEDDGFLTITIPVAVNTCAVSPNDELVLYRPLDTAKKVEKNVSTIIDAKRGANKKAKIS